MFIAVHQATVQRLISFTSWCSGGAPAAVTPAVQILKHRQEIDEALAFGSKGRCHNWGNKSCVLPARSLWINF